MSSTEVNRAIVETFVDLLYRQRDVRRAFETCVVPVGYIQHNPGLPDGRDAAIAALAPNFSAPGFRIDPLHVLVDGDHAVVHLKAVPAPGARPAAVADIFRLENGLIVEHWDVIQAVPEAPVSRHPMF